ncbi:MAG: alanine racemase [Lentisphaerae bacterium GWF2_45_14]|nr:MAG: alanine racemase [Lentisphaerae bacterium GWF2_45_14]
MEDVKSRVRLDIDLKVLRENFSKIADTVSPCSVIAVLKANAYGLGVLKIAETLVKAGAAGLAVAELNEALEISSLGKPVQILGGVLEEEIPEAVRAGIILPITSYETAQMISREALRQNKIAECEFLIDTGMGRLGFLEKDAEGEIEKCVKLPGLDCGGIYSHFPIAYRTASEITESQICRFLDLVAGLGKKGITFRKIHMANSDALNNFPITYCGIFNRVRTGINLYGAFDNEGRRVLKLESVLTLKTKVVAVRKLPAGMSLGYGCTYKLLKDTLVGTIAAGYADGLPLALSNRGYVLINNMLCPVLGRVSMDYTVVSLENVPGVKAGDEVICLGGEGINAITVENWAQIKGTHAYDVICSFGSRVKRNYINA